MERHNRSKGLSRSLPGVRARAHNRVDVYAKSVHKESGDGTHEYPPVGSTYSRSPCTIIADGRPRASRTNALRQRLAREAHTLQISAERLHPVQKRKIYTNPLVLRKQPRS
jgi:hypothetical protein